MIRANIRIGAHVANDRQASVGRLEGLCVDERWDLRGKVDAVDKDVSVLDDLLEGPACRNSCQYVRLCVEATGSNEPFLVSSISHCMMSDSGIPTSLASCTAPLPHRPSCIMLTHFPPAAQPGRVNSQLQ